MCRRLILGLSSGCSCTAGSPASGTCFSIFIASIMQGLCRLLPQYRPTGSNEPSHRRINLLPVRFCKGQTVGQTSNRVVLCRR